jgi:parvulin-like peptidyl-prolyl isomerase
MTVQRSRTSLARWLGLALAAGMMLGGSVAGAQESADKIVASVNGESIGQTEFFDRLQRLHAQDFLVSVNPPTMRSESAGEIMMQKLITERLILQWASKTQQLPTTAEVNTELEAFKRQPNVTAALAQKAISEDMLRYSIKVDRARFNIATTAASVSPPEVEAYYKAHIAQFSVPERWGLAAIRTSKPEAIQKAEAELQAGKPFAEVAKTYSEDTRTKENGGLLGTFTPEDKTLPDALKEAIKKLKVGEVSPPVKFDVKDAQGNVRGSLWFVVRLVSKEPGTTRPFADVKEQVERMALLEKAGGYQVADKKIQQFWKESDIKVNMPGYQNLANAPKKS